MEAEENPNSGKSTVVAYKELSFLSRITHEDVTMSSYGNEAFGYIYEPVEVHFEKLKSFQMRDDDVLLCSTVRSGSHWMFRVLDMLMTGKVEYRDFHLDQVNFDLQRLELLDKLPSPRLLQTHLPFDLLPQQIKDKRTKIVHIYRNPKAATVSSYFMFNKKENFQVSTLDMALDTIKTKWTSFWDGLTGYMKENPDNPVFNVAYEEAIAIFVLSNERKCISSYVKITPEMVPLLQYFFIVCEDSSRNGTSPTITAPQSTVKRLRTFLCLSISDYLCDEIADACNFGNQKSKEDKMNADANINFEYFRGNSDWKNHMTVAQSEEIDKFLIERKDRCMFAAKYVD